MGEDRTATAWAPRKLALACLTAGLLVLLAASVTNIALTQRLFVGATFFFMLTAVVCWAATYLHAARDLHPEGAIAWLKDNYRGVVVAAVVTAVATIAVEPALRVLSDEANLLGVSKNLFASKTATFTVSGKNYYGSYWDVDVAIDRRPTLFPFLVALVHAVCGYSYRNVFLFNALVLAAFVFVAYRLAKSQAGETAGVVSALFVASHPIVLISARSGGFDLLAACFGLLVVKSLLDQVRAPSPARLAILWMNLCLFSEVRYETALFIPLVLVLLLVFRSITWRMLRPYALVYALTPAYLMPRIWQSLLRGNVPEQDPGTVTFSAGNFVNNLAEYFAPLVSPAEGHVHSVVLIVLGLAGCLRWLILLPRSRKTRSRSANETASPRECSGEANTGWLRFGRDARAKRPTPPMEPSEAKVSNPAAKHQSVAVVLKWLFGRLGARAWSAPDVRCGLAVAAWLLLQAVIVFSYVWGRAQYPSSARLVIAIDTFFAFAAAFGLTRWLESFRAFVAVLLASAVFVMHVPVAAEHRIMNRLTQSRENAVTWDFFERLGEKRILIVTDRPNHFTIMNYGAMDFESARRDPYLFTALARRLFHDVYVIQQIRLSTNQPLPKYEIWPDRRLETVLEFQNDADVLVRVSRVPR